MTSSDQSDDAVTLAPAPAGLTTGDGLEQVDLPGGGTLWHADTVRMARMTHTVIGTEVPGLAFVAGLGEQGITVERIDYRAQLADARGPAYVDHVRTVATAASWMAEIRRRPLDPLQSTVTAYRLRDEVIAVYDDHYGDGLTVTGERAPGRRLDQLRLKLERHDDLAAWLSIDGKAMDQEAFGDAIEERLHTIVEPDQADLLAVIDTLRVTSNSTAESRISRANGSQVIEMSDEHQVSAGQLVVPEVIRFAVPVYEDGPKYVFAAWFRVRVDRGQVRLHVKLKPIRPTLVAAWGDILNQLQEDLGEGTEPGNYTILEA